NVLLDPDVPAGAYPVVGPRSLTGPECAQVWFEALGVAVSYAGDDDAALEAALTSHLSGQRLDDWLSSFRALRGFTVKTKKSEVDATVRLLGRTPTDFPDFVSRIVAEHGLPAHAGADGTATPARGSEL